MFYFAIVLYLLTCNLLDKNEKKRDSPRQSKDYKLSPKTKKGDFICASMVYLEKTFALLRIQLKTKQRLLIE